MKNAIVLNMMFLVVLASSCVRLDCEQGSGRVVREEFFVSGFDGIRLEIDAEVFIQEGDDYFVEIEAEGNIIDLIDDDLRSGLWEIDFRRCVRRHDPIQIYITAPPLNTLTVSGSGRITHEGFLDDRFVDLSISGSGRIDAGVVAERMDVRISGSGDVIVEGSAESVDCVISGSGDLRGFDLSTLEADLTISGSGNIDLTVTEFLRARISGSGDIRYRGNPTLDVSTSGSGSVTDDN